MTLSHQAACAHSFARTAGRWSWPSILRKATCPNAGLERPRITLRPVSRLSSPPPSEAAWWQPVTEIDGPERERGDNPVLVPALATALRAHLHDRLTRTFRRATANGEPVAAERAYPHPVLMIRQTRRSFSFGVVRSLAALSPAVDKPAKQSECECCAEKLH